VDIPETQLKVSRVALGTWAMGGWMWGGTDQRESVATIHAALHQGINLIDTAPVLAVRWMLDQGISVAARVDLNRCQTLFSRNSGQRTNLLPISNEMPDSHGCNTPSTEGGHNSSRIY
jgi:hypothetical protein